MGIFKRLFSDTTTSAAALAAAQRSAMLTGIVPPSRAGSSEVSPDRASSLHSVYRALDILTVAGSQLSIDSKRRGEIIGDPPAILRRPNLEEDRADFIEQAILSLALDGNLFWLKKTANGSLIELETLNPYMVTVRRDQAGVKFFQYQGKKYSSADIIHRYRFKLPGQLRGRSAIQAAAADLNGALQLRDYATDIFDSNNVLNGILASDQPITAADAKQARYSFDRRDLETGEPLDENYQSQIRVLGKGFSYEGLTINPKDAQWLENQGFNVTVIARMFGVPASLMLATLEGNSSTYANVEQDWLAFVRFTLMGYLSKIESAFTEVLPLGQSAKFNTEALLRSDTKTRYQGHQIALGRWMTVEEVRAIENMPALTPEQRADLDATATQTPTAGAEK